MTSQLETVAGFDNLKLVRALRHSPFLPNIKEILKISGDRLTRVPTIFPHYTMHDIGHSIRIIKHMGELIEDVSKLTPFEIALLIYSAILHDVGMATSNEDIELLRNDKLEIADIKYSAMLKYMGGDEVAATQEFIRRIHGKLSAKYILSDTEVTDKLVIPGMNTISFAEELAAICQSHTESYDFISRKLLVNDSKGEYHYNGQYIATILRIADILDIDPSRAPYSLFRLISPEGNSEAEWKQHFIISNTNKVHKDDKTGQKRILFQGYATSAKFHRKLLGYIDTVKTELRNAVLQVKQMLPQYALFLETIPESQIQPKGYTFSDFQMTLQFSAISSLLMGEKIYGARSLGLRELIQNSIDACKTRQETQDNVRKIGQDKYVPRIKIILDEVNQQVIIKDNGAGMSEDIIKNHFLNIGVSYYSSKEFKLRDLNYKPIGNFGIGFLSCFMLSDEVTVYTRHYQSKTKFKIDLEKGSEFTSLTQEEDLEFEGTEVILQYKHFISAFDNKEKKVEEFVQQYFLPEGVEIYFIKTSVNEDKIIERPSRIEDKDIRGLIRVNFSDYFDEFSGYALIRPKNLFVHSFDEINFSSTDIFLYNDDTGFISFDKSFGLEIDSLLSNGELKYMSIPIVEAENEKAFLNGLEFTEGEVDKVIEKMGRNLRWITVIFKNDERPFLYEREIDGEDGMDAMFRHLVSIGHSSSCKTKIFTPTLNLFEGEKNKLYLPFEKNDRDLFWIYMNKSSKEKELFIRNVLIKDFPFSIEYTASLFEIVVIEANILSRTIIPDISRNKVDSDGVKIINYAVGKAIHLAANTKMGLTSSEKSTLTSFIKSYYSYPTEFEKS